MPEIEVKTKSNRKHKEEVADALKEFKKQMKKSGILQELRKREHFTSPSKAKRLKRSEAQKQRKRDERKQQRREENEKFF